MNKGVRSSGSVYMLERHEGVWKRVGRLTASDAEKGDSLGQSVSLCGQRLVVGASGNDDLENASGSAYLFSRVNGVWTEETKLLPSNGAAQGFSGGGVSISGNWVFVGSNTADDNGRDSGSVYAFALKRTEAGINIMP